MKSLKDIIDRYEGNLPKWNISVLGFLSWGGKEFYEINSNVPVNLNKYDENGESEIFFTDKYEKPPDFGFLKAKGKNISKYYPHPYFPDKKPIIIEVIRILPGKQIGSKISVSKRNLELCMEYPEFYKPIYQ